MREFIEDILDDRPLTVCIAGIILFLAIVFLAGWWYEDAYPCLKHGPREIQYITKEGLPIYGEPCLERGKKGEIPKWK